MKHRLAQISASLHTGSRILITKSPESLHCMNDLEVGVPTSNIRVSSVFHLWLIFILLFASSALSADKPIIAAGGYHSLALATNGTLWVWGCNSHSQLGDGTTVERDVPFKAKLPTEMPSIIALSAGEDFTLALTSSGTVWSCGRNDEGQLGDGTTNSHSLFVPVPGITHATAISAGQKHSLVITQDGAVWGWGSKQSTPAPINGLPPVISVTAGGSQNLALTKDGQVWSIGGASKPSQVAGLSHILMIAAGLDHYLALGEDGTVWSWGDNEFGQLGNGTQTSTSVPQKIPNLSKIKWIGCGYTYSFARSADRKLYGWGDNNMGQLGAPHRIAFASPREITVSDLQTIVAGGYHTLFLKSDSALFLCGHNFFGQLGNWTTQDQAKPAPLWKQCLQSER